MRVHSYEWTPAPAWIGDDDFEAENFIRFLAHRPRAVRCCQNSVSIGDLPIIERTGFFTGPNLPLNEPRSSRTIGKKPSGRRLQRPRKSFTAASEVFDCAVKV